MGRQVQILECDCCANYIVADQYCQVKIFLFDAFAKILYNCFINRKGPKMTDTEFYRQIQEDWYNEFAGAELSEIFVCTNIHAENYEFDDVPF